MSGCSYIDLSFDTLECSDDEFLVGVENVGNMTYKLLCSVPSFNFSDNDTQTIISKAYMFNSTWGITQYNDDIIIGYIGDLI